MLYIGKSSNTMPNLPKGNEAVVLSSNSHVFITVGIDEVDAFVMNPVIANVSEENPVSCNSSNFPFGLVLIDTADVSVMSD
jgi:hypothetical protein